MIVVKPLDKIDEIGHLIGDGWLTEAYDLGVTGGNSKLLDLIERCEADVKKEIKKLVDTEIRVAVEAERQELVNMTTTKAGNTHLIRDEYGKWGLKLDVLKRRLEALSNIKGSQNG